MHHRDRGVLRGNTAAADRSILRGQSHIFDRVLPALCERAIVAVGTHVVVVEFFYILGREHVDDGFARPGRRWWGAQIFSRRVERCGLECGGRRGAGIHFRDVILERKKGGISGVVARAGADIVLPLDEASRSPRIEHGTVTGLRLQSDGRRRRLSSI